MMKYLILISFLMFSCSKIETGLNFAPRIATSKIDDAFDFDSEKLTKLRKQIDADLQSSKKALALKLIYHIENLLKQTASPNLNKEELILFFDSLSDTQTTLVSGFKSSAALTFKDLSAEEIKSFKSYSDKKYKEELELTEDKKAFSKKKRKTFANNYEIFLNNLTLEQENLLSAFIEKHLEYFKERILSRQKFSEEFYLKIKSKDAVLDFFLDHYAGKKFKDLNDPNFKAYLNEFFQFQIELWQTTTEKQKSYFQKKLLDYKDELQKIANKT